MQVLITRQVSFKTVLTTIRDEWMFSNYVPLSRKPIFKNIINILTVLCSLYNIYKYILNTISILLPYMYNNSMLIIMLTAVPSLKWFISLLDGVHTEMQAFYNWAFNPTS